MLELRWDSGGTARLITTDGDRVSLESTSPAPPGTPLCGTSPQGDSYRIKVRGCRRVSSEPLRFRIDGRFINLSRHLRQALLAGDAS